MSESDNPEDVRRKSPRKVKGKKNQTKSDDNVRAHWTEEQKEDLIDIILSRDDVKEVIYLLAKPKENNRQYQWVHEEFSKRHPDARFTIEQLRNKYKNLQQETNRVLVTIKTATGIDNYVTEKGHGEWFARLAAVLKSKDSNKPGTMAEPGTPNTGEEAEPPKKKRKSGATLEVLSAAMAESSTRAEKNLETFTSAMMAMMMPVAEAMKSFMTVQQMHQHIHQPNNPYHFQNNPPNQQYPSAASNYQQHANPTAQYPSATSNYQQHANPTAQYPSAASNYQQHFNPTAQYASGASNYQQQFKPTPQYPPAASNYQQQANPSLYPTTPQYQRQTDLLETEKQYHQLQRPNSDKKQDDS